MARTFATTTTDNVGGTIVPIDTGAWSFGCWYYMTSIVADSMLFDIGNGLQYLGFNSGLNEIHMFQSFSTSGMQRGGGFGSGFITTATWVCVVGTTDGTTAFANAKVYMGSLSAAMADKSGSGSFDANGAGTRNTAFGNLASIGNRTGSLNLAVNGRVAQAFLVPWAFTLLESEQFRQGDWSVIYQHGQPRFFLPLQGAGLYDLSGSF